MNDIVPSKSSKRYEARGREVREDQQFLVGLGLNIGDKAMQEREKKAHQETEVSAKT